MKYEFILYIKSHTGVHAYFSLFCKGYHFNATGLLACEPFYSKPSFRILSSCAFYFPTTMALMYCYGSSFHANRRRFVTPTTTTALSVDEKVIVRTFLYKN